MTLLNMKCVLLLCAILSTSGLATAEELAQEVEPRNCEHSRQMYCGDLLEPKILTTYPDIFERKGNDLIIKNKTGTTRVFKNIEEQIDETKEGTSHWATDYHLLKYWPETNWALVSKSECYGECLTTLLIDLNSSTDPIAILGWPEFSPNNQLLAVYNLDVDAGWFFNGIKIYSIDTNRSLIEQASFWTDDKANWGVYQAEWKADNELVLQAEGWCKLEWVEHDTHCKAQLNLVNSKSSWKLY